MLKKNFLIIPFILLHFCLKAQEVSIIVHYPVNANVSITNITDGVLDFGSLIQNEGQVQITLNDSRTEVIRIQAYSFNDVNVTITAPPELLLDPSNTLPFSLDAAYANNCQDNKNQAKPFNSDNTASFPMIDTDNFWRRLFGCGNRNYYAETYIYIFGDVNVGNVNAGTYSGIINIYVEYD